MVKTHLVIGDAHADPNVSNRRFDWLGNFILENRPDVIIDIGDWGDFSSIGSYDKGKKEAWGKSFLKDAAAYRDASKRAFGGISKVKGYRPKIIRCGGNHEEGRINKMVNDNPELEGLVSLDKLGIGEYNEEYVPFRDIKIVDGIAYCHYFYDRDSRYPLQTARAVLTKKVHSGAFGHTHIRDFAETVRADGSRVAVTNVGCFLDPERKGFGYAGLQGVERWWSGLCLFKGVDGRGSYDLQFIGIKEIQKEYS